MGIENKPGPNRGFNQRKFNTGRATVVTLNVISVWTESQQNKNDKRFLIKINVISDTSLIQAKVLN